MAIMYVTGTVAGPTGKRARVKFLVDSGAKYTLLPQRVWKAIKLRPLRSATFILADGTEIERQISECYISLAMGKGHTPVILGEGDDDPLLGMITLEEFGLVLHPFNRTLQQARLLLA